MNEHQYNAANSLMYDIELKTKLINDIKNIIERLNVFEGNNCEFYIKVLGAYPETKFCINFTKKINETIKESLEESKEKYKTEIKELRKKFKAL